MTTPLRIFRGLEEARDRFAPSSITIGNFDGVHAGRRALMQRTLATAAELGVKPSALTFHPHPTTIVAPERAPRLLTTPDERCALMAAEGIQQVLILPFDRHLAGLSPDEFLRDVLVDILGAQAVIVGDNFHFGHKQAGTIADLRRYPGLRAEIVPLLNLRGVPVSSSEIRRRLASGDIRKANRLLGRPYSITGSVVPGDGRGSKQTVPTLNLQTTSLEDSTSALPADGVYITRTTDPDSGRRWDSVTNIGFRPTFDGQHLTIETFLFGPLIDLPPARIRLEFLFRLRAERKFESAEALRAQIIRDVTRAQSYFRRVRQFLHKS